MCIAVERSVEKTDNVFCQTCARTRIIEMSSEIRVFRCLSDNIGVLVNDPSSGTCVAIDAPDHAAIQTELDAAGWQLTDILVTHSHSDHVQGISTLKKRYGCKVTAPEKARDAVPEADAMVKEGDRLKVGSLEIDVWELPGHCVDHVGYIVPAANIAFVGDVLFTLGCGRVFGGAYEDMWRSLGRLMELPDDMLMFGGHDYTLSNARFALAADPGNALLKARAEDAEAISLRGGFLVPTRLGDERATNPFLRTAHPALARSVSRDGSSPFEVFKALREWKNSF